MNKWLTTQIGKSWLVFSYLIWYKSVVWNNIFYGILVGAHMSWSHTFILYKPWMNTFINNAND